MARTETYEEVCARIDTVRDSAMNMQDKQEFNYPIYKKSEVNGLVVKFTGLREGEVVDTGSSLPSKGFMDNDWVPHTDEVWQDWTPPSEGVKHNQGKPRTASDFLAHAKAIQDERGKTYDSAGGERSMGAAVTAFNAITKRDLSESEGWLLLVLLKHVRQWNSPSYHEDSAVDAVSYEALLAECLRREFGGGE